MKTVLFFPQAQTEENFYLGNLTKTISGDCRPVGMNRVVHGEIKGFFAAKACHLNWLENIRGKSEVRCIVNFIIRFAFLICLKILRKKIVWTVHNKVAHDQNRGRKYSIFLMGVLMRWSDKIHILCEETLNEVPDLKKYKSKICIIPHGDYFQNFGEGQVDLRQKYKLPEGARIILFTGKIGPYKNLDLLIDCFNRAKLSERNFVLLICGACKDETYKRHIEAKSKEYSSVVVDFHFIENNSMGDYLNQSDILVAPYDIASSLNSGTMWMAFSYKKTMILPEIGCVRGEKVIYDNAFVYHYSTAKEHEEQLTKVMMKIKDVPREALAEKGTSLYNLMQQKSWESHKADWLALYD